MFITNQSKINKEEDLTKTVSSSGNINTGTVNGFKNNANVYFRLIFGVSLIVDHLRVNNNQYGMGKLKALKNANK